MSEQAFNPREHLIQIRSGQSSNDYLPVQWRLVWFREKFPNGSIETEIVHLDLDRDTEEEVFVWNNEKRRSEKVIKHAKGVAIFKATVKDGMGGIATGTGSEKAASFGDFLEKAETKSIGRALAALGFGTQFTDDLDEKHRIVDSPVARPTTVANGSAPSTSAPSEIGNGYIANGAASDSDTTITEQQLSSIRKLYQRLGKTEPETITSISKLTAQKLIKELSAEFNASKQGIKAS